MKKSFALVKISSKMKVSRENIKDWVLNLSSITKTNRKGTSQKTNNCIRTDRLVIRR